jgi:hypothetical protein
MVDRRRVLQVYDNCSSAQLRAWSRVIACKLERARPITNGMPTCARTHTLYEQDVMSPRGMQEQQQQIQKKPQIQQKHTNVPGYDQLSGPFPVTNKPRASPPSSTPRIDGPPQLSGPREDWPQTWPKVSEVFCLLLSLSPARMPSMHAFCLSILFSLSSLWRKSRLCE